MFVLVDVRSYDVSICPDPTLDKVEYLLLSDVRLLNVDVYCLDQVEICLDGIEYDLVAVLRLEKV